MSTPERSVAIIGATGLVGRECVRQFAAHGAFARVVALVRRALPDELRLPRVEAHVVDFDRLDASAARFAVTHVLSALGTTIRQAGSQERFRAVDFGYALSAARLGRERGAHHFLLVSALGASAASRVFYNRVKGELEDAVRGLGYRSLTIVRPSLLLGPREELRPGEVIGRVLGVLAPSRYRPVQARDVARALLEAAVRDEPGIRVIESQEIRRIAETAASRA